MIKDKEEIIEQIKAAAEKCYPIKHIRECDLPFTRNYELNQIAIRLIEEGIKIAIEYLDINNCE